MEHDTRVLVLGAGIGGLTAGAAFAQRGFDVDVIEIKPDNSVFGVGINQPANALRAAGAIGVMEECLEHGFQAKSHRVVDRRGDLLFELPSGTVDGIPEANALPRKDLGDILLRACEAAGARLAFGTTTTAHEQDDAGVDVTLSDGRHERYHVVAAFDGIHSPTRRALFGPEHDPVYTGYGVWRVTVERPRDMASISQFIGPRNKAGVIPLNDETMYLFLVMPSREGWRPDRSQVEDLLREQLEGYGGMVGDIREGLAGNRSIVYSPIEEVLLTPPWQQGRIVVLGDSAHACAPHLTQGGAQAMEDAVVLAEMFSEQDGPVGATLDAFVARRYPRAKFNQDISHAILVGEMDQDPEHQRTWGERFDAYMHEAHRLLTDPA